MRYRAEIDGLRAVAILGVLVYHLKLFPLGGGYLGVDVFFVISGYLITSLIIREVESSGAFSFSNFYLRRVRRIVPALLAVLLAAVFAGQFVLVGSFYSDFYQSVLAAFFYCANIFYYFGSGYWDFASSLKPLLHTWSLGIEEQFYLLFPLLAWFVLVKKKTAKAVPAVVVIALTLLSFFLFKKFFREYPDLTFYLLPTRLWELTAGAAIAFLGLGGTVRQGGRLPAIAASLSLAAILLSFFFSSPASSRWHPVVVMATAALIALPLGPVQRLLASRPFIWIGKISYSLYLWHWPLWVFWNFDSEVPPSYADSLLILVASVAAAYLSWRFVEQPFRKIDSWRRLLMLLAVPTVILVGFTGWRLAHAPVFPVDIPPLCQLQMTEMFSEDIDRDSLLTFGPEGMPDVLLIGDSHAMALLPAVKALSDEYRITTGAITKSSTVMFEPDLNPGKGRQETAASALAYIRRHDIRTVVIAQRWQGYPEPEMKKKADAALRKLLAEGRAVYLVEEVPNHLPKTIVLAPFKGRTTGEADTDGTRIARDIHAGIADPHLHLIRAADRFASGGEFVFVHDNKLLYRDGNHLNVHGADFVKPALRPVFEEAKDAGRADKRRIGEQ